MPVSFQTVELVAEVGSLPVPACRMPATPGTATPLTVVKTTDGEMTIGELKRRTARTLELQSLKADHADRSFAAADVAWVARIVWAKQ